jgi:hypothetical protein
MKSHHLRRHLHYRFYNPCKYTTCWAPHSCGHGLSVHKLSVLRCLPRRVYLQRQPGSTDRCFWSFGKDIHANIFVL